MVTNATACVSGNKKWEQYIHIESCDPLDFNLVINPSAEIYVNGVLDAALTAAMTIVRIKNGFYLMTVPDTSKYPNGTTLGALVEFHYDPGGANDRIFHGTFSWEKPGPTVDDLKAYAIAATTIDMSEVAASQCNLGGGLQSLYGLWCLLAKPLEYGPMVNNCRSAQVVGLCNENLGVHTVCYTDAPTASDKPCCQAAMAQGKQCGCCS